ncbi:MAG: hypothetical protein WCW93_03910 [Candidatus Paceibacterota bacterium]|jgi:hypothetical protein
MKLTPFDQEMLNRLSRAIFINYDNPNINGVMKQSLNRLVKKGFAIKEINNHVFVGWRLK